MAARCCRPAIVPPPRTPPEPTLGPRATAARLIELRQARRYAELRELVVPEQGTELVSVLMAVDGFLDANRALCNWIRDHVGVGIAQTVDQSYMGNVLGIFSLHADLLDEAASGSQAEVSFTVAGRLPVRSAHLRKIHGVWRFDPEGGYSEHLPAAFREMATGLERTLAELRGGRLSTDELRNDPQLLADKVKDSLRAGVRRLSAARAEAEGGE